MVNKNVIITGSSSGHGYETAVDLLTQGANVIFACRDENKAFDAIDSLPQLNKPRASFLKLDLCSLNSVYNFTNEIRKLDIKIDVLINNAGVIMPEFKLTEDGIETIYQVHYFGHKILTYLLLDLMNTDESRVINVSGKLLNHSTWSVEEFQRLQKNLSFKNEEKKFNSFAYIANAKLATVYFAQHLAESFEFKNPYIKFFSVHPGVFIVNSYYEYTKKTHFTLRAIYYIIYPFMWYFSKTVKAATQTTLYLCYEDFEELENGQYYADCKRGYLNPSIRSKEKKDEFMKWSDMVIDKAIAGRFVLSREIINEDVKTKF